MDFAHPTGHIIADRYRIVRVLGRGGAALTYEAEDLTTSQRVAVKQLLLWKQQEWKALELFEREAKVLASLSHPSIPRYIDYLQIDSEQGACFYLVQELAPGVSLAAWIGGGGRVDEAEAIAVARQLLRTLVYLGGFAPPIIHRDIKPQNILRRHDGTLYLVDFGAARDVEQSTASGGSTVVGTFGYMAPEQFRGKAAPATDLYGLGATLLFLLTRRSPADLPQRGMKIDFRGSVQVSRPFADWLDRLLEPEVEKRFPSAVEALRALDRPAAAGVRWGRVVAATLAAGLLVGGGAAVLLLRSPPPRPQAATANVAAAPPAAPPIRWNVAPVRTLSGHWSAIFSVAFHPDGKLLATASNDFAVKLWDLDTGESTRSFAGHTKRVASLAFPSGGSRLVSAGDTSVRTWSLDSGAELKNMNRHGGMVTKIAITPDGGVLASACADGLVRLWDPASGDLLKTFLHGGRILSVAITPNGNVIASAGDGGKIKLWSATTGAELNTLEGHTAAVNEMIIAPDGQTLVSASDDRTIRVWHLGTAKLLHTLSGHADEVWTIALAPNGKTLLSGSKDDTIRLWDLYSTSPGHELRANLKGVITLAIRPDGKQFAAAGGNNLVHIWPMPGQVWRAPTIAADWKPPVVAEPPAASKEDELYRKAMKLLDEGEGSKAYREAQQLLQEVLAANPSSALAHAGLGRVEYKMGFRSGRDYDPESLIRAHAKADEALKLDPKLAEALVVKGWAFSFQGNYIDARRMMSEAERLRPDLDDVHLLAADIARHERRPDEALARMKKILESDKSSPRAVRRAYSELTSIYRDMGEWDAAEEAYLAVTRIDPGSAWAKGNFAAFLIKRGEHDRAIEMARAALAIADYGMGRKTLADAHCEKGLSLLGRHDLEGGKAQFDAAEKARPRSPEAAYGMAMYWRAKAVAEQKARHLDTSKALLEGVITLEPEHRRAKAALAEHDVWVRKVSEGG